MRGPTNEDLQRGAQMLNLCESEYGKALAKLDFDAADSWAGLAFGVFAEIRRAIAQERRPWFDTSVGGAGDRVG